MIPRLFGLCLLRRARGGDLIKLVVGQLPRLDAAVRFVDHFLQPGVFFKALKIKQSA